MSASPTTRVSAASRLRGAVLLLAVVACTPPEPEGDDDDATIEDLCPEAPAPSLPCLEGCGNELRVGYPCTRGGGECSTNTFPEAIFCTIDFEEGTDLAFCTRPCVIDLDCGSDALCTGDPGNPASGRGCFPLSCWTPPFWEGVVVAPDDRAPTGDATP